MRPSIIAYTVLAFFIIVGYNVLLIQRDTKLFQNAETMKERYCAQPEHRTQPNCTVE